MLAVLIALALVGSGCRGHQQPGGEILVFAAVSTSDALAQIGREFTVASGITVRFSFGASNILARQLVTGAPADVFVSADRAQMDELEQIGLVRRSERRDLLANVLVVVVPKEGRIDLAGADDLLMVERLAIADPEGVPAGVYAREWLSTRGLWRAVAQRLIPTSDVRAALAAVESGSVDAAIVYRTDAAISRRARVAFTIPEAEGPRIRYQVAPLAGGRNPDAARAFITFLAGREAQAIFARHGFIPLI